MRKKSAALGHLWNMRELRLGEETFLHRQCLRCRRDLVLRQGSSEWRAVHVCAFRFDCLDDQTTLRWRTDDCPGETLTGEVNRERMVWTIVKDTAA